jgi:hypothetical protein
MSSKSLGSILIMAGVVIVAIGLLVGTGWLSWFGRLPGDIRIERDNVNVYNPLASMLLLSAGLSLIVWIVKRIF